MPAIVLSQRLEARCIELWGPDYESHADFDTRVANQLQLGRSPTLILADLDEICTHDTAGHDTIPQPYVANW